MWKDDDHIYASPGTKQAFSAEKSEQLRNIAFSVMVLILHTFSEKKKRELHCHYPKDVPVSSLHPLISLPLLLHKQCPLCHVHQVEPTLDVVTKRSRSPFGYVFLFVI